MNIGQLTERRKALFEQHRQAMVVAEQTRGALMVLDEIIAELQTNGTAEIKDDVEATSSPERSLSS
jgi:hypothetical protein